MTCASCSIRTWCAIVAGCQVLYYALVQHRVCYFDEAGDVCSGNIVAAGAVGFCGLEAGSMDAAAEMIGFIEEMKAKGAEVVFGPFESPVCWVAAVLDPDGNSLWIHQRKDGTTG